MSDTTLEKQDQTKDFCSFTVKGRSYNVQAMPLQYVQEYMEEPQHFVLPDGDNYRSVMFNFAKIPLENGEQYDMLEFSRKWIPRLVKYGEEPCTLDRLFENGWTIVDFGKMLVKALAISG